MDEGSVNPSGSEASGLSIIEHLSVISCVTEGRPLLRAKSDHLNIVILYRPRCRLWTCPSCGDLNKRKWVARIAHGVKEYQSEGLEFHFVTLTSHRKLKTAAATIAVFKHAWYVLSQRARRKHPGMKYVLIPERHESEKLHCHLLTSAHMETRWYKDNSASCGLGYIADEERLLSVARAAYYVSKYAAKQVGKEIWPKGYRRIRTSRSWPQLPPFETGSAFETEILTKQSTVAGELDWWKVKGYTVYCFASDAEREPIQNKRAN